MNIINSTFLKLKDDRFRIIIMNVGVSVLSKAVIIIAGFVLIPMSLKLVTKSEFGLWLTISSFLGWIALMDFGIGKGLRNMLAESQSKNDTSRSKMLVSTAYFSTIAVFLTAIILFVLISFSVDWRVVLHALDFDNRILNNILIITFSGFAFQMIFRLVFSVYNALHKTGMVDFLNAIIQVFIVAIVYAILKLDLVDDKLLALVWVNSYIPMIILVGVSFAAFYSTLKGLRPHFRYFDFSIAKSVFGLGFQFLILQIVGYILIGSQQYIVGKLFSQEHVVNYTIPQKYYSLILVIWVILTNSIWSMLTEAHERKDFEWIRKRLSDLFKLFLVLPILGMAMFFMAPTVYYYWIGEEYLQNTELDISLILFFCVISFNTTVGLFLNAFSKLKFQLYISILVVVLALIIYVYFDEYFKWELYKVPIVSAVFLALAGCLLFFHLNSYLKKCI